MTTDFIAHLDADLAVDEGFRDRLYHDSVGVPTIGIGINLFEPVDHDILHMLYERRRDRALRQCTALVGWSDLSEPRQAVLVNMCYNLGWHRLSEFRRMFQALAVADFEVAAIEMLDSEWARQVGARAQRLAIQMSTDIWQEV